MEDTTRLRLILVGLFLAAAAIGYFIFDQRRNEAQQFRANTETVEQIQVDDVVPTLSPATLGESMPQTTKGGQPLSQKGVTTLPATGAHDFLIGIFSVSAAIIGFGLRKFPK